MKTRQLFFLGLLGFTTLFSQAQNVSSTTTLTSGGLEAGTTGTGAFYGYRAGKTNTSGFENCFIGNYAGYANTTGMGNVALGAYAGKTNIEGSRNVYIGLSSGFEEGNNESGNVFIGFSAGFTESGSNKLVIGNSEYNQLIWGDFAQNQLKFNGKVGIGYDFGNFPTTIFGGNLDKCKLFVRGGILAEEVRISLQSNWADYVFAKDYKLPTLEEVEKYIQEKGHLPNVPSAQQVKKEGIELGEMAKIQQEKIEELTLYAIEQNKINQAQNKEIEKLKKLVKSLLEKQ